MQILSHFALLKMCKISTHWKTPMLPMQTPLPPSSAFSLFCSALLTAPLHSLAMQRRCSQVLLYFCRAATALLLLLLLPYSDQYLALISSRTGCRTASSAMHFSTPKAGFVCRKCSLMQAAPTTKTCSRYLRTPPCAGATCQSAR